MRATAVPANETDVLGQHQSTTPFAAIERICSAFAHDLKNPVNNILLSAAVLKEMKPGDEQESLLEMIIRNADRINGLLSELINATQITELEIRTVNICDLLDEVLLLASTERSSTAIIFKRNYPEGEHFLRVDPLRMKKALLQLVSNSIEATNNSTVELELSLWEGIETYIIELKDNGCGIAADLQQQIFEPYFTTKQGKRGLGLTIAQTIVVSHGGSLTIHSYPPHGTTTIVHLPVPSA